MLSHEEQNFVKSQLVGAILIDKDGNELKIKSLNFHQEDVDIVFGRMSLVTIHQETALKLAETGESKNWKVKGFTPVEDILEGDDFEGIEDLETESEDMEEEFEDDYEILVNSLNEATNGHINPENYVIEVDDDNGDYLIDFSVNGIISKNNYIELLTSKDIKFSNEKGDFDEDNYSNSRVRINQEEIQKFKNSSESDEEIEEEVETFMELSTAFENALKHNQEQLNNHVKVMMIVRGYGIDLDGWMELEVKDFGVLKALPVEKQKALIKELKYYYNPEVEYNHGDLVCFDVPLFIRLLEWAREDAIDDLDLHKLTENAMSLMKSKLNLHMEDYNSLIPKEDE